jgi:hypothetical protein
VAACCCSDLGKEDGEQFRADGWVDDGALVMVCPNACGLP